MKDTKTSWKITVEDGKTKWTGQRAKGAPMEEFNKSPDASFWRRTWKWITNIVPESLA
ncbi:MAG: hypothetical protein LBF37_01290 [Rickettsiales bacterium]|nr:hypothetical protein [Rickettsiales bacterium]